MGNQHLTSEFTPMYDLQYLLYTRQPHFVLGFHGCDLHVQQQVVNGLAPLHRSENAYDWLGHGIYFWENNPQRALEFAQMLTEYPERSKGRIQQPAVIGAIIDLGHCLNLMESSSLALLKSTYHVLVDEFAASEGLLPRNLVQGQTPKDLL